MLRFTLLSLVVVIVAIVCFGNKMNTIKAHHIDAVSQAEQIMAH